MSKSNAVKAGWGMLKSAWNYTPEFLKSKTAVTGSKATRAIIRKVGAKGLRGGKLGVAGALGLGSLLGDSGPEENETTQRAMNQLKYGADMTDEELQEAMDGGREFKNTGIIGEGGLSEADAMAYIAKNADQRGTAERIGGDIFNALSFVPGVGQVVGLAGGAAYDSKLKDARNLNLQNIVGKLKADANEGTIRKNMEGSLGKFMSEGLLNKEFGRGKVRGQGGIKPAEDPAAKAAETAALKEYEAIKAKEGVHVALAHPSAKLAGRTVYEDVQEASGGDKNTAEAMLSGAGLTDDETSARYYGDPKKNAEANSATQARAAAAAQSAAEAAAKNSPAAQDVARSGPIDIQPAKDEQGVRDNQATIAASTGFHGEPDTATKMRAYMEYNGRQTARNADRHMRSVGDAMYEKAYGYAPGSPDATADAWNRLHRNIDAGKKQYQANRAARANVEYDKHIVKPGDPDYKLAPQAPKGPTDADMADYMALTAQGGGTPAPTPAPAGKPTLNDISGMYGFKPGELEGGPGMTPEQKYGPQALAQAKKDGAFLSPNPNVMKPTPNGLGGPTPGMPQLPDIGGPARRAGEAIGDAIFSQDGTGVPLPGGAKLKAPIMGASPYGIGNSPSPGAMPQLPDIGGPARRAGGALYEGVTDMFGRKQAPNPYEVGTAGHTGWKGGSTMGDGPGGMERNQLERAAGQERLAAEDKLNGGASGALTDEQVAKMLAAQKAAEATRKGGMKMPAPGGSSPRFRHPSQVAPVQPYKQNLNYKL